MVWATVSPFVGIEEIVPVYFFGIIFLYCIYQAYIQARRRNIEAHQNWVLRLFSIGLGVSTNRILFLIMVYLTPLDERVIFPLTLWLSWVPHLLVVEWWIQANTKKASRRQQVTPGLYNNFPSV